MVLAASPERADAWRERARCLVKLRNFDAALAALDRALELEEPDAWSHYERGYLLNEMGRFEEALATWARALALDPRHAKTLQHRGAALLEHARFEAAVEDLSQAIALWPQADPELEILLLWRAQAWHRLERPEAARADLERADALAGRR